MILTAKTGTAYVPHPEGTFSAVCIDLIDLGDCKVTYQGQTSFKPMLRLVFETEHLLDDGRNATIHRRFTQSLHEKSALAEFLGEWRGKKIEKGESIDLAKLIGASCTLRIRQDTNQEGGVFSYIKDVEKPTKKLKPSGHYDPAAARERIAHWASKDAEAGAAAAPISRPPVVTAPASPAKAAASMPPKPKVVAGTVIPEPAEDDVPF